MGKSFSSENLIFISYASKLLQLASVLFQFSGAENLHKIYINSHNLSIISYPTRAHGIIVKYKIISILTAVLSERSLNSINLELS